MARYRKKPVVIDAVVWDGDDQTADEIADLAANSKCQVGFNDQYVYISTLEGEMAANLGDYVIRGVQGEIYPCKPDIFEATYEPA